MVSDELEDFAIATEGDTQVLKEPAGAQPEECIAGDEQAQEAPEAAPHDVRAIRDSLVLKTPAAATEEYFTATAVYAQVEDVPGTTELVSSGKGEPAGCW